MTADPVFVTVPYKTLGMPKSSYYALMSEIGAPPSYTLPGRARPVFRREELIAWLEAAAKRTPRRSRKATPAA